VRSFIHASSVPTTNEKIEVPAANCSEFRKSRQVSGLEYAFV